MIFFSFGVCVGDSLHETLANFDHDRIAKKIEHWEQYFADGIKKKRLLIGSVSVAGGALTGWTAWQIYQRYWGENVPAHCSTPSPRVEKEMFERERYEFFRQSLEKKTFIERVFNGIKDGASGACVMFVTGALLHMLFYCEGALLDSVKNIFFFSPELCFQYVHQEVDQSMAFCWELFSQNIDTMITTIIPEEITYNDIFYKFSSMFDEFARMVFSLENLIACGRAYLVRFEGDEARCLAFERHVTIIMAACSQIVLCWEKLFDQAALQTIDRHTLQTTFFTIKKQFQVLKTTLRSCQIVREQL